MDYSTLRISQSLMEEIKSTLSRLDWGSVEIYVQDSTVVQITKRQIRKTTGIKKTIRNINSSLTKKQ